MNNTLDFNRLGKVVKHDGASFTQNLSLALIILWSIPLVIWLFSSLTPNNGHIDSYSRISIISTLGTILLIMAPARLYKYCNDSRQGIRYAMLPASSLEKFISMVFYCVIVAPVIYLAGALAIDSILAVLGGPYEGFAIADYFNDLSQFRHMVRQKMMMGEEDYTLLANYLSPTIIILSKALSTLAMSSVFMFGNMVFKKRKTGKMIGILILLFIIFMIIMVNYVANHEEQISRWFGYMNEENAAYVITRMIRVSINASLIFSAVVSVVMLWLTYYKIKTQKY
jgi:hypothetical protein